MAANFGFSITFVSLKHSNVRIEFSGSEQMYLNSSSSIRKSRPQ